MSLIPLKQNVTITPAVLNPDGTPQTDEWDRPVYDAPYTLKCRIQEGTKLVRSASGASGVHGVAAQEVVSIAQILFDKHPSIGYYDKIMYTDEYGQNFEWQPLNVEVKRNLSGKPILTVVSV